MPTLPAVAVTATTELIRGVLRVRANSSYTESLRSVGLRPFILPVLAPEDADAMLDGMDGLLLTGGEDLAPSLYGETVHPTVGEIHAGRDAFEIALVLAAKRRRVPTLAICRGIQVANVALGGTLVQDIPSQWPRAISHDGSWPRDRRVHAVDIEPGSQLAAALGATHLEANSFHHQAVKQMADGLAAVAHAPDGVVEGAEWTSDDWWFLAVQWHPEELTHSAEPWDRSLFQALSDRLTV